MSGSIYNYYKIISTYCIHTTPNSLGTKDLL